MGARIDQEGTYPVEVQAATILLQISRGGEHGDHADQEFGRVNCDVRNGFVRSKAAMKPRTKFRQPPTVQV